MARWPVPAIDSLETAGLPVASRESDVVVAVLIAAGPVPRAFAARTSIVYSVLLRRPETLTVVPPAGVHATVSGTDVPRA